MKRIALPLVLLFVAVTALSGLSVYAATGSVSAHPSEARAVAAEAGEPVPAQTAALTVSYVGAASWLDPLPADQRLDQIRDYAVLGLADLLDLDLEQLRNALYDGSPVRDPLFQDLASQSIGPGRSLYDGVDTLHILVPDDDAYPARTVGLALDDYRKNAGADPEYVTVYGYAIDDANQLVSLSPSPTQPASATREAYGYREVTIAGEDDLARFLEQTQHMSRLALDGDRLVAGGWQWPGAPAGYVTPQDLAVLQRGYLAARGDAMSVKTFLTDYDASRLDVEITIPDLARQHAHELDAMYADMAVAKTSEQYGQLLDEYADLILDVILDPAVAADLQSQRTSLRHDEWIVDLSEAFADAFEANQLWPVLRYVAGGSFYVPADGVTEPGFSLDPAPLPTLDELIDTLAGGPYPQLQGYEQQAADLIDDTDARSDPDLWLDFVQNNEAFIMNAILQGADADRGAELVEEIDGAGTQEAYVDAMSEYYDLIFAALDDREAPWKLLYTLRDGDAPFQFARYDGGLEGTDVGMTYFYTDILAKGYFYQLGSGNPYGIVAGFQPDGTRAVPWSHCTQEEEQGRIWFGLNESAVGVSPQEVDLGSVATHVFVLVTDPVDGAKEVEPSYKFGQGIRWWDQHYMDMADYEPQYHRLDQLMRWGAAISWLVEQDMPLLPTPSANGAKSDWRFDEWLSAQPDLTWRYDLPFVQVDGVDTETVLRLYSQSFDECGSAWVTSGGISNPSLHRMRELADQPLDLPVSVARAGLSTTGTEYDTGLDAGKIATLDGITRELKPIDTGTATVSLEAPGRKVWSFGDQKVDVSQEAERTLQASLSDADDGLTWGVRVEDQELGEVSVRSQDGVAEIDWQPGPLAAVKPVLDRLQDLLLEMPLADALAAAFAPEDVFDGEDGYVVRVAGASDASGEVASGEATAIADGATWLAIGEPSAADEGGLQFRLAKPVENPDTGRSDITWYSVRFAQTPVVE